VYREYTFVRIEIPVPWGCEPDDPGREADDPGIEFNAPGREADDPGIELKSRKTS
jgi:hypothetical protein